MNILRKVGMFCAMLACGGSHILVADKIEDEYQQVMNDLAGIVGQRDSLKKELATLQIRYGMQKDKIDAVNAVVASIFPGESAELLEQVQRLVAAQKHLKDAIAINQTLEAQEGAEPGTIVSNVKMVIDQLHEKNVLIGDLNKLIHGNAVKEENNSQSLSQLLQEGIVCLIDKQNDTIVRLENAQKEIAKTQKNVTEKAKKLRESKTESRKLKKEVNKLARLKEQLNLQITDLTQDNAGLGDKIKGLMQMLDSANKKLDQVRGYFVNLLEYAEKNKE